MDFYRDNGTKTPNDGDKILRQEKKCNHRTQLNVEPEKVQRHKATWEPNYLEKMTTEYRELCVDINPRDGHTERLVKRNRSNDLNRQKIRR